MVSYNHVKFGCHGYCESGDTMFQVVEEQDFACLNSP